MEIRKLTIDYYEEIINLWVKDKLPHKPKGRDSKKAMTKQIQANPQFFLGAFDKNRLVGTVIISCDTRKGWINRLAVDPDYSRRGIAKTLIAESEKILRKHGIRIFCALVEGDNKTSRQLFRKCGYVEHGDIIYFSKRDSDEI